MSTYPPGTRVEVWHDQRWRRGTIRALADARRDACRRQWPMLDWTRAVAVALDTSPRADDLTICEPERSALIRPARHLRAVRALRAV